MDVASVQRRPPRRGKSVGRASRPQHHRVSLRRQEHAPSRATFFPVTLEGDERGTTALIVRLMPCRVSKRMINPGEASEPNSTLRG